MTVASTSNRKTYAGDDATESFATSPVEFFETSNLQIRVVDDVTGDETLLVEGTDYDVTGGDGATGTVDLGGGSVPWGPLLADTTLVILRVLPLTQETDFVQNDGSDAEVAEEALDRLAMADRQVTEEVGRAFRLSAGDVSGSDTEVPTVEDRAGKLFGWDAAGLLTMYAVEIGTSIVDLLASTGASLVGWIQAGTGAVLRTVSARLLDRVSVFDFMSVAQIADVKARTSGLNVAAAIQAAIDYAFTVGCTLYFPEGTYFTSTTTLVFKNKIKYCGAGKDGALTKGTIIYYTGTSDAIQINNPIDSSTATNITVEDMWVHCTTRTAGKAAIADVGSTFLSLHCVGVDGNDYGIILDQSELVVIDECAIEISNASAVAGIWLVNGPDHTAGADPFFTNRITIEKCQFNGGSNGVAIADDGGLVHIYKNNNFNGCAKHIRASATRVLHISGNEFEGAATTSVEFAATQLDGTAASASTVAKIDNNFLASSDAISLITFAASSLIGLDIEANEFDSNNVGGSPTTGLSNVTTRSGRGNTQQGTGTATVAVLGNYTTGTLANDSAPASAIGELISGALVAGSAVSLTSTVAADVISISLTPGDWDVTGVAQYNFAATTSYTILRSGISTISATFDGDGTSFVYETSAIVPAGNLNMAHALPTVRISLSATTTVYLVSFGVFSVSTLKAYGVIRARRIR